MEGFKCPRGAVQFRIGSMNKLPCNAEEIKLFMVSGDPSIYIVPMSQIPIGYINNEMKIEPNKNSLIDFQI